MTVQITRLHFLTKINKHKYTIKVFFINSIHYKNNNLNINIYWLLKESS